MPYFARLDEANIVISNERVDSVVKTSSGDIHIGDNDADGEAYFRAHHGTTDRFRFNKYDGSVRYNFPGPGFFFDEVRNAFIPPKPFASWVLDEATCRWVAPVPKPEGEYRWDEATTSWVTTA